MKSTEEVHTQVKDAYGRAISKSTGCCCGDTPDSANARAIGYSPEETAAAGEGVAGTTMGCGNPLAFSGVQAGETVLDLGSGAGLDLLIAAEKVGPTGRVIGVDMTTEMIARARANIAASPHRNIEIRQGIIEDLPVEDGSVDWVISNCVINLSPEKGKVFAEIYRVLKPEGRFSISDIVVSELPDTLRENPILYNSCVAGAISEEDYLAGLQAAGLADLGVNERFAFSTQLLDSADVQTILGSTGSECCASASPTEGMDLQQLARELDGKVQSLNFVGRKPGRSQ
ncbi:MAG: arsenite methyltransferase [Fidelibacterota bacterium]|nr:MAG: arsenite methyltransferase [Candidatus Neomarinimicrobiota bacterium]